ncbi:MAG: PepSY-like domain-containing protein [Muribaculaceae bacterium]|nr:PepSY-like domain-containing protein [Muribaculaceae bacterium]
MKKLLLMLGLVLGISAVASAKDTYAHDDSVLPEAARTTIANNFKSKVSVVKIEKDFGRISEYEVILSDGTEISFDRNGNWENVETSNSKSVPSSMVPKAISDYVAKNQPKTRIVGIDKERNGYEIELSNGVDMKFDAKGNFKKYD